MSSEGNNNSSRFDRAVAAFKQHGGILRTSQAIQEGIHTDTLYTLRNKGTLETVSRGVYRLAESAPLGSPDLVTVAARIPGGVICLISALSFHEITTQIPHVIHVALPKGSEEPRLQYPPIKTYRFTGDSFTQGVETHEIDGVNIHIYNPEKTIADCFKFRNKIGLDTVIEAVRLYRERKNLKVNDLIRYASICRVTDIIKPYLEAIL